MGDKTSLRRQLPDYGKQLLDEVTLLPDYARMLLDEVTAARKAAEQARTVLVVFLGLAVIGLLLGLMQGMSG